MSEDTIAEIDDALMRGLPGLDDTAFWLTVEELPSDDGSAAIGTDGEESFNRALGALPAERQSPPSPPAVSLGRCMAGRQNGRSLPTRCTAAVQPALRLDGVHMSIHGRALVLATNRQARTHVSSCAGVTYVSL